MSRTSEAISASKLAESQVNLSNSQAAINDAKADLLNTLTIFIKTLIDAMKEDKNRQKTRG